MIRINVIFAFIFLLFYTSVSGQSSVLSNGKWSRFSVAQDGVYKIDYALLKKAGFDPSTVDPHKIRLFTGVMGMLPQANNKPRVNDLIELAIYVHGENDGVFNKSDYILFFAKGPDNYSFDLSSQIFQYENNLYDDKNYYFLTIGSATGKRMPVNENPAGTYPSVNEFEHLIYYETESHNELESGRQWFGEQFSSKTEIALEAIVPGIIENSSIKIISSVMAKSFDGSSFQFMVNDIQVLDQVIATIPNTRYGIKGRVKTDTVTISANTVSAPGRTTQRFTYNYTKTASTSVGYLDFFSMTFQRKLALYGNQTVFSSSKSLEHEITSFVIENVSEANLLWDITDPYNPSVQLFSLSGSTASFTTPTQTLKTFVAFSGIDQFPTFEASVPKQNLHGSITPDFVIITHPDFLSQANRLAAHRRSFNSLSVLVVTTEEVFNEYAGGKKDVTAIRDFIRDLYLRSGSTLQNALLFGRGSYDYKDRVFNNTNFVPTYESRNSLSPLETYSSDDYFGFLEDNEGEWGEKPVQNHTLDVGIGRLPVKTLSEATNVVDKLIEYDSPSAKGRWRNDILFIADDGDFNTHQGQADQLATWIDQNHPVFNTQKIYLDAFPQITRPSGQVSPETNQSIQRALKKGQLIVNFTGHGSERIWMDERVLDETTINEWQTDKIYPLMVTATCEFGRNDDPGQISSGEKALFKSKGGAIGLVTTARPVNASTNFFLNQAFYESLFITEEGQYRNLGSVFRDTKNNSVSGISNRNFSLLGDPSMRLALPEKEIVINEIFTESGSAELKSLSHVHMQGEIQFMGSIQSDFNGVLEATVYDRISSFTTLGDENAKFPYTQWNNSLFRGQATFTHGQFELEFILPVGISPEIGLGKINLYARSESGDASGIRLNIAVGGTELSAPTDTNPPIIKLFMEDETFLNGGITSPDPKLVAHLSDATGINISMNIPGKNPIAILDDTLEFNLSEYYIADADDFMQGTISFPFYDLEKGSHRLEVMAYDIYGNGSSASIDFIVTEENRIEIDGFKNYPNPFSDFTTIQFAHNRAGEDLEAYLSIYSPTGQSFYHSSISIPQSSARVTLTEWHGTGINGIKLSNGIYLMKLLVRSLEDGSENEEITRLIILN